MFKLLITTLAISSTMATQSTAERLGFNATALDDYVAKEDSTYKWHDTGKRLHSAVPTAKGLIRYTGYVLNMTSQTWLTEAESSNPVWTHHLVICVPENYAKERADWAALWITWGKNDGTGAEPKIDNLDMIVGSDFATGSGLIVGVLY